MSLQLNMGSTKGLEAKTYGIDMDGRRVVSIRTCDKKGEFLREIEISHEDFSELVKYWLRNEPPYEGDPRPELVEHVTAMRGGPNETLPDA